MALRQSVHLRGIRTLAAINGSDMTIGVICTLRGAQATEKAAQLGLFLIIMIITTYIYNALNDALSASRLHNKLKTILSRYIHIQNRQS